jgi:hypothetical protein
MENIDSMDNQPSISCGFVETMQLDVGHGRYGRPCGITYTEEVAGSSPVPPTRLGAVLKGQPFPAKPPCKGLELTTWGS